MQRGRLTSHRGSTLLAACDPCTAPASEPADTLRARLTASARSGAAPATGVTACSRSPRWIRILCRRTCVAREDTLWYTICMEPLLGAACRRRSSSLAWDHDASRVGPPLPVCSACVRAVRLFRAVLIADRLPMRLWPTKMARQGRVDNARMTPWRAAFSIRKQQCHGVPAWQCETHAVREGMEALMCNPASIAPKRISEGRMGQAGPAL